MANDEKVEFVKQKYPDLNKINAHMDELFCDQVKKDLIAAGLYTRGAKHLYDTAIRNIILRAQGKKVYNRRVSKRTEV